MKKQEFLEALGKKLSGLPQKDVQERLSFFGEMIDDRMEDGLSEDEAVTAVGSLDSVIEQIAAEIPLSKIVKDKIKLKNKWKAWEITLLALGSPIWISLAVAVIAIALSLYVSAWSVIISLWAVFASLVACVPAGIAASILFANQGYLTSAIFVAGCGLICAGLSIFAFAGCKVATRGLIWITKKIPLSVKLCFLKKEESKQ